MFNTYIPLEKLSEFIGREQILADVRTWLADGAFHVIFYEGQYGVGKTRLLNRILEMAQDSRYPGAPLTLIDLYHTRHHYPEGLARGIVGALADQAAYFIKFSNARKELDQARSSGDSSLAAKKLEEMLEECINGLVKLSQEKGLLLLFDTVELWIYPQDAASPLALAGEWLKTWIGKLPKGVVVFAGRPQIKALSEQLKHLKPGSVPLQVFTATETEAYLEKIAQRYASQVHTPLQFDPNEIQLLHQLSNGQPILLALYLELYLRNNQVKTRLSAWDTRHFEQELMDQLMSEPELGEVLKAAGRAPKGVDQELLARLLGITKEDAAGKLEMLSKLSFAKTFTETDRIFLHDEMYNLLHKTVYKFSADLAEAQQARTVIYEYYAEKIKEKDTILRSLFEQIVAGTEFETKIQNLVDEIRKIEEPRQAMKTESVYYRLRQTMIGGLRRAYRYIHEAVASGNGEILIPIQLELSTFLRDIEHYPKAQTQQHQPFLQGLLLLYPLLMAVADGKSSDVFEMEPETMAAIRQVAGISEEQRRVLMAIAQAWRGTTHVFGGNYTTGGEKLGAAIELLKPELKWGSMLWFRNVTLCFAHRQRAYMVRVQGRFAAAKEDFQEALRYSRDEVDFWFEESTARDALGIAQMNMGDFQDASENLEDALDLRYRAAIGSRIALSHTSLAQYHIATRSYDDARLHAQYALNISDAIGYLRGRAFGFRYLAEATRRKAFAVFGAKNQLRLLNEARRYSEDSKTLSSQLSEPTRQISAILEHGCVLRDLIRLEEDPIEREKLFKESDKLLMEAAALSSKEGRAGVKYLEVDARVNRIWLGVYANRKEFALTAAKEALAAFPSAYFLKQGKVVDPSEAEKDPILWSQLGKLHVGLGSMAMADWSAAKGDEKKLLEAATNLMLGLEYSAQFEKDHRGLREGRKNIFSDLKKLNLNELKAFTKAVKQAESAEGIQQASVLQKQMLEQAFWYPD